MESSKDQGNGLPGLQNGPPPQGQSPDDYRTKGGDRNSNGVENGRPKSGIALDGGAMETVSHRGQDTVVSLRHSSRQGCYFTRVQVAIFTGAFLICLILVVLLLTFLRTEQVIRVQTDRNGELCVCSNQYSKNARTKNYSTEDNPRAGGDNFGAGIKVRQLPCDRDQLSLSEVLNETLSDVSDDKISTLPTSSSTSQPKTEPWHYIRLPRTVLPIHYNISLKINLSVLRFDGNVSISINVTQSTRFILVHVNMLRVSSNINVYEISADREISRVILRSFHYPTNQFYVIELKNELEPGKLYVVQMNEFRGHIFNDLKGLYLSTYESDGNTMKLAATQLQSTDARKVFPCFDEPDMKATFRMTIQCEDEYTALSNMPVERESIPELGWKKFYFQTTPIMSTYIIAIVVSQFEFTEKQLDGHYHLRMYSQPDKINQTLYALENGEKMYEFFTDYFQIVDVVPKADHVAVPDFSGGAMENWGLVIYRETSLLYDPDVSSSNNQLMVTLILAHEIAHTWFGNMVTMRWWDDLWLNEGFASLLMYFAMDDLFPEWDVFSFYVVVKEVFTVMEKDALVTSHPVSTPIETPDDIAQYFDTISYNKGMAVLRMLLDFVGWESFRQGLQLYVTRYKFDNAEMDELWRTFSEAVNNTYDIKQIMDTWTRQMGFPVVNFKSDGDFYILEQERFLLDGESCAGDSSPFNYTWHIPFTYVTDRDPDVTSRQLVWLNRTSARIPKNFDSWILGNLQYSGFYRVNYELSMWQQLAAQLNANHTIFTEANRAGLIGDSFNLARAQLLDYEMAFTMTTYLKKEDRYVPWVAMLDSIKFIRGMFSSQGAYVLLRKYLYDLVKPVFEAVGAEPGGILPEKYLKETILTTACDVGVESAIEYAKEKFRLWKDNGVKPPSDYALTVYSVGVREGSVEEWDHVWNMSRVSNVAAERDMLMEALARTQKPWLLWRYANWIFDGTKIKRQDVRLVVSYFAQTPLGRMIALNLLMNKWDQLNEQFGADGFLLRDTIGEVTKYVNTEFEHKQLELLFNEKRPKLAFREAQNALELIRGNIRWMKNNYDTIEKWLRNHVVGML